jgi:hypothetical protein
MRENRETSSAPERSGRSGKANNHNPDVNALEESDCAVVPVKQPNEGASAPAEDAEGRAQGEENEAEPGTGPTRSGERVYHGRRRVRRDMTPDPGQEPYAVIPLVRICAGGGQ